MNFSFGLINEFIYATLIMNILQINLIKILIQKLKQK